VASSAGFPAERIVLRGNAKTPAGLLGSQITRPEAFETAATRLVGLMADIHAEHGVTLPELNLGGGHGVPYADDDQHSPFPPRRPGLPPGRGAVRCGPAPRSPRPAWPTGEPRPVTPSCGTRDSPRRPGQLGHQNSVSDAETSVLRMPAGRRAPVKSQALCGASYS